MDAQLKARCFDPWCGPWLTLCAERAWPGLTGEERIRAVAAALALGQRAWTGVPASLARAGPLAMARQMGIEVVVREGGAEGTPPLRAAWWPAQRRVEVFAWSLRQVADHDPAVDALALHVAHELFHVLHPRRALRLRVGRGWRAVALPRATEVAAHTFAAAWAGLAWYPGGFDHVWLLERDPVAAARLAAALDEALQARPG